MLLDGDLHDWKVDILHDAWPSSVHLLHELPHPIVDYEVILLFLYIVSQVVLAVE